MANMKLEQWAADERARIDRFVAMWAANAKQTPEHWPMKMPPGEWDEQFRAFESGEE